jgi:hypothetical protein
MMWILLPQVIPDVFPARFSLFFAGKELLCIHEQVIFPPCFSSKADWPAIAEPGVFY